MRRSLALLALLLTLPTTAAAQGTVIPLPVAQFLNAAGTAPCNACKLYHYVAGTTTVQDVFSTATLTPGTELAQPVVLSSTGRATIFLSQNSYRFALYTSANVLIWDQDNVSALSSVSEAGNTDLTAQAGEALVEGDVVYLSDGSGSLDAGKWYLADSDNAYSALGLVGFATETIDADDTGTIRLSGRMTGLAGLTPGETYFVSATAGDLTATPPAIARVVGVADTTSTVFMGGESQVLALPDSDGTAQLIVRTSSNLTATRTITLVPGDADRTVTLSGNLGVTATSTINQDVSTTATPTWSFPGYTEGRLTLTTAVPVTTADVTAAGTIYYTPHTGNRISLYDGSATWTTFVFTERSLALTATSGFNYDVFLYSNSGTVTLETAIWTNDTTRATALTLQNGVLVKTGATTRRYMGTFRASGANVTEDSVTKRFLYNHYNRVEAPLFVTDATNTWAYGTDSFQQANASAANQVAIVNGWAEERISLKVTATATTAGAGIVVVSIGEDSVTTPHASAVNNGFSVSAGTLPTTSILEAHPAAVGYHYYAWLERAGVAATFLGDNGGTAVRSGMTGSWVH